MDFRLTALKLYTHASKHNKTNYCRFIRRKASEMTKPLRITVFKNQVFKMREKRGKTRGIQDFLLQVVNQTLISCHR